MRFAIMTTDRYIGVFKSFLWAGWRPVKVFVAPVESPLGSNRAVLALAEHHKIPVQTEPVCDDDLRALRWEACDALVVACYPWRIGAWQEHVRYAVNFHCSPLPEARGPYPLHRAILEKREEWAVTCHKVAPAFDTGDIIASQSFPMVPNECHESLDLKIHMTVRMLAARVAGNFVELWQDAVPQGIGSYWPKASLSDRVIAFHRPVEDILRHVRAYGETESLACVEGEWIVVKRAMGWQERHAQQPGEVAYIHLNILVVAAVDGYVGLIDITLASPDLARQLEATRSAVSNE